MCKIIRLALVLLVMHDWWRDWLQPIAWSSLSVYMYMDDASTYRIDRSESFSTCLVMTDSSLTDRDILVQNCFLLYYVLFSWYILYGVRVGGGTDERHTPWSWVTAWQRQHKRQMAWWWMCESGVLVNELICGKRLVLWRFDPRAWRYVVGLLRSCRMVSEQSVGCRSSLGNWGKLIL